MRRPWLEWSRQRFLWSGLAAWSIVLAGRILLVPVVSSTVMRSIIWVGLVAGSLVLLYVTFTWAKEYDRRNPRH